MIKCARSGQMTSWHTGRIFSSQPKLNANFVYFPSDDEAGGQNRIFVKEKGKRKKKRKAVPVNAIKQSATE